MTDNYKEHKFHYAYDEKCSECYKNVKEFDSGYKKCTKCPRRLFLSESKKLGLCKSCRGIKFFGGRTNNKSEFSDFNNTLRDVLPSSYFN